LYQQRKSALLYQMTKEDTVKKIVLSSKVKRTYSGSVKVFANGGGGSR
jgi:hypothetical protein